jgi:hypothetical protein
MSIPWLITGRELGLDSPIALRTSYLTDRTNQQRSQRAMEPPLRSRAQNRWLRRVHLELTAAHRVRMNRLFDDLVSNAVPLNSVAVFQPRPPLCAAAFLFANDVHVRLTRCDLRTIITLAAVLPDHIVLERVRHNGALWALSFRSPLARIPLLSVDASPVGQHRVIKS